MYDFVWLEAPAFVFQSNSRHVMIFRKWSLMIKFQFYLNPHPIIRKISIFHVNISHNPIVKFCLRLDCDCWFYFNQSLMRENLGNYKHIIIWNNNWCDKNGEEWAIVQTNFNAALKGWHFDIAFMVRTEEKKTWHYYFNHMNNLLKCFRIFKIGHFFMSADFLVNRAKCTLGE